MSNDSKGKSTEQEFLVRDMEVPVPWGVMTAKCWGDPRSRPVLVVHGIQDNAGSFDRLIPLLGNRFYYVCIDLPGHGKSSRYPKGIQLSFMEYLSAINRFVRHLSWTKFYYLGHSLGGQLGVYYAAMYPDQVIKLITLDSYPYLSHPVDEFLDHFQRATEALIKLENKMGESSPPSYTYEEAVQRLMTQRPSPITREAAEALAKRGLKSGRGGFYFSMDQRLKFGVRYPMTLEQNLKNITKLKCPYLMILTNLNHSAVKSDHGSSDGRKILETFESMKNTTIVLVDGYHDVHNNEPETVAPHICKFLIQQESHL